MNDEYIDDQLDKETETFADRMLPFLRKCLLKEHTDLILQPLHRKLTKLFPAKYPLVN